MESPQPPLTNNYAPFSPTMNRVAANFAPRFRVRSQGRVMRIAVATCNRADYSKLAPIMKALRDDPDFQLHIIVIGSHLLDDYGNTYRFIEKDGFDIDTKLHTIVRGEDEASMVESMGLAMIKLPDALQRIDPDIILVHGDRFDALSVAVSAAVMNIRVVHLEGGEVSGTIDDTIRHSITKLAHFHICCTETAFKRLESMCEDSSTILMSGCPAYDELLTVDLKQYKMAFDRWIPNGVPGQYIVCIYHPVTTSIQESVLQFDLTIEALERFGRRVLVFYPNVDAGSKDICRIIRLRKLEEKSNFYCLKNLPFADFIPVMGNAGLIIGNSSCGIREAGAFGVPVINIGTRQRGREFSVNVLQLPHPRTVSEISNAIQLQFGKKFNTSKLYGNGGAVNSIIKFLKSINSEGPLEKNFTFGTNLSKAVMDKVVISPCDSLSPRKLYGSSHNKLAIAVDIGGSYVRVALVNMTGQIICLLKEELPDTNAARVLLIKDLISKIMTHSEGDQPIAGIGISSGGRVNSVTGEIMSATSLIEGWGGMNLRQELEEEFPIPVKVENDGNCAALAEKHFGTIKKSTDFFCFVHIGTGIGGGIIVNNHLLTGSKFGSGEIGHLIVGLDGPECSCGLRGCVEAFAAGWALDKAAVRLGEAGFLKTNPDRPLSAVDLIAAHDEGIPEAIDVMQMAGKAMAAAVVNLINTFNPSHIVFGGHLAKRYVQLVTERLQHTSYSHHSSLITVQASDLKDMSLIGAASLVFD